MANELASAREALAAATALGAAAGTERTESMDGPRMRSPSLLIGNDPAAVATEVFGQAFGDVYCAVGEVYDALAEAQGEWGRSQTAAEAAAVTVALRAHENAVLRSVLEDSACQACLCCCFSGTLDQ